MSAISQPFFAEVDVPEDEDDVAIMEANGCGMDAYDDGNSVHDNPYQSGALRDAWHQGWMSAQRHRGD